MWPPQSVNTWPTPAPLSVRATSSPPVIQSEGRAPSEPPRLSSRQPPRFTDSPRPAGPQPPDGLRLARPPPPDSPPPAGAPPPPAPARPPTPPPPPPPRGRRPRPPPAAARPARPHPQPRLAARVAEPPRPPLGSHGHIHRLASRRASPSLRGRRSARTATSTDSPRPAGPQPRDGLRLALPLTRISPT